MPSENLESTTGSDARLETRRRREQRTDHVLEFPFNVRNEVQCPTCEEEFEIVIGSGSPAEYSPSFGCCPNWDCDAYHKYVHDGPDGTLEDSSETSEQANLSRFNRGGSDR